MTLVSESRLMSFSVLYDLMYPVSVLTNVLSILDTFNTGVTFLVLINIHSFVFSPYKIKSHFLVSIKYSISIFSPYIIFPSAFLVPVKKFHQPFWSLKCLRKMSQGLKSVILFCRDSKQNCKYL